MITSVSVRSSHIDINPTTMHFVFIILCVLMLLLTYFCWNFNYWKSRDVFSPRVWPFFGSYMRSAVLLTNPMYDMVNLYRYDTHFPFRLRCPYHLWLTIYFRIFYWFDVWSFDVYNLSNTNTCADYTRNDIDSLAFMTDELRSYWFSITNWSTIFMWNISIIFHTTTRRIM